MIDLMNRVLKVLLMNTVIPVLVKTGHLDDAIHDIRRGAVDATVSSTRVSKKVIGKHFGRSERWIYKQLEALLVEEEPTSKVGSNALIFDVMDVFSSNLPKSLNIDDVFDVVKLKHRSLKRKDLVDQFQVYVDVGLLKNVDGEERYGAAVGTLEIQEEGLEDRLARIGRTAAFIMPASLAYARGESSASFGSTKLNVTVDAWDAYVKDVKRFAVERGHQAVIQSLDEDPGEAVCRSYIVILATAALDED